MVLFEQTKDNMKLVFFWQSGQRQLEEMRYSLLVIGESRILLDSPGKGLAGFVENNVLEGGQRHERSIGYISLRDGGVGIRAVKSHKVWGRGSAFEEGIHPPAIAIVALADVPLKIISKALGCNILGNGGEVALSPGLCAQEA